MTKELTPRVVHSMQGLPSTRLIRPGGLMRCCVQTLNELPADRVDREGEVLKCNYCEGWMRFCKGAWEWMPEAPKPVHSILP